MLTLATPVIVAEIGWVAMQIVDTRHEGTATFAAEAYAAQQTTAPTPPTGAISGVSGKRRLSWDAIQGIMARSQFFCG